MAGWQEEGTAETGETKTYNGDGAAARALADLAANVLEVLGAAGNLRGRLAVEVGQAEDIGGAALGVAVQGDRASLVVASTGAGVVVGGESHGEAGGEGGDDGDELHFCGGGVWGFWFFGP